MNGWGEEGRVIAIYTGEIFVMQITKYPVCNSLQRGKVIAHNLSSNEKGGLESAFCNLNLHDNGKDHGIALGGLKQITAKIILDRSFQRGPVPNPLPSATLESFHGNLT